jgi:hypothetical protein
MDKFQNPSNSEYNFVVFRNMFQFIKPTPGPNQFIYMFSKYVSSILCFGALSITITFREFG